ncbi:unnamed protein product [Meganyctiphanes norvegica]|uniref:Amino acid transporter transmembrane domain-containing protein n=1 Tax=Meganyctiphanes norvegica TaxID=48144 RepID=A0AAV2Q786_MEGNR
MSHTSASSADDLDGIVVQVVAAKSRRATSRRGEAAGTAPTFSDDYQRDDQDILVSNEHPISGSYSYNDLIGSCQITSSLGEDVGISWYKAMFLIVNAALGAGLLNFPKSFEESGGLVSGNVVHIVFTSFALGSLIILGRCCSERNCKTYQELILHMVSPGWSVFSAVCITLYCYVTCITFIIIIGDQFDRIFASYIGSDFCRNWYLSRQFTMTISSLLLIIPSLFKRIDSARFMSYVGVLSIWYLCAVIVVEYFTGDYKRGNIIIWDVKWTKVFDVVPTICFGYQCHVSSIPIYSCLKKKDAPTFSKACVTAVLVCLAVYTLSANFGYLTFGTFVDGDVLLSYDATKPWVLIAVILLAVKSWTTYPILLFCVREAVSDIYVQCRHQTPVEAALYEPRRRTVIAIILWGSSIILAIFTPNINIVVKLLGCLAALFIFIFPGMCLLQMTLSGAELTGRPYSGKDYALLVVSVGYIVLGSFALGLSFTTGIQHILKPDIVIPICI